MLHINKLLWKTVSIMTYIKTIAGTHYSILMAIKAGRVVLPDAGLLSVQALDP